MGSIPITCIEIHGLLIIHGYRLNQLTIDRWHRWYRAPGRILAATAKLEAFMWKRGARNGFRRTNRALTYPLLYICIKIILSVFEYGLMHRDHERTWTILTSIACIVDTHRFETRLDDLGDENTSGSVVVALICSRGTRRLSDRKHMYHDIRIA
jgi:hypothetical protein